MTVKMDVAGARCGVHSITGEIVGELPDVSDVFPFTGIYLRFIRDHWQIVSAESERCGMNLDETTE